MFCTRKIFSKRKLSIISKYCFIVLHYLANAIFLLNTLLIESHYNLNFFAIFFELELTKVYCIYKMNLICFNFFFPDMEERNRIYSKMMGMTPTQCAWLCAIIEELGNNANYRKYINLFILVKENSIVTKSTVVANEVYHFNVPVLRYKVHVQLQAVSKKIGVIAPGHVYPNQKSAFFYGHEDKCTRNVIVHKLFLITTL